MAKRTTTFTPDARQISFDFDAPTTTPEGPEAVVATSAENQTGATIAEFERMARELGEHVANEEERTGIRDVDHFAYSTFAKAARIRIGKIEEDIRAMRDRASVTVPTPTFPAPGTSIHFRETGTSILVLGTDGVTLGHVDPVQAPVLSRVLDRITRDTITSEMGKADEATFEVVLHRKIDGDTKRTNVVRCHRIEPEHRQAA